MELMRLSMLVTLVTVAWCGLANAQPVVKGMGRPLAEYVQLWGQPEGTGDGFLDAYEKTWKVKRKGILGPTYTVRVFFRNNASVEERWIRPGSEDWTKDELWAVLDGKGPRFTLLKRGTPLLAPFTVLQSPNTLINFMPGNGEMAGQLQNTLQGPQIRIASRMWAQAMVDMGLGTPAGSDGGRTANRIESSSRPPAFGNRTLAELVRPLKDLGVAGNVHSWQPRNGRGTFALTTLKKGTRLELFVPDPSAATAAREVLAKTSTQGTYGTMPPLREALSESFRRFHGQAVQAVPDVIASPEWVASRVTGTFTDEVLQDLVSFGRLPDEFSLLNWKSPEGVTWDLLLTASGWKLTIFWPQGKAP